MGQTSGNQLGTAIYLKYRIKIVYGMKNGQD